MADLSVLIELKQWNKQRFIDESVNGRLASDLEEILVKTNMQQFAGRKLGRFCWSAGVARLGLMLLIGLAAGNARAQFSFGSAQPVNGINGINDEWGSVTNDNTGATPDLYAPNIAGFAPNHPLWYKWKAPHDGEVEMDTVGSVIMTPFQVGYDTNLPPNPVYITNTVNLDTVLGVYQGTSPQFLNQIAANDDLYPVNISLATPTATSTITLGELISPLPEGADYFGFDYPPEDIGIIPAYYGPSHLRFTAQSGQFYYFAVDTKTQPGPIVLNWAYKSSGVFAFASEDQDYFTGLPQYQTSETESQSPLGSGNVDVESVVTTYYNYNAPGVLVTVSRRAGSAGRAIVNYQTVDGTSLPWILPNDQPGFAGVDYEPVSGQLVFDDFEMSKTILIPILYRGTASASPYGRTSPSPLQPGDQTNRVFGIQLIDDSGATSPQLDGLEDSSAVSQPRVDPVFATAEVKILNTDADPWGPDLIPIVHSNVVVTADTNIRRFSPPTLTYHTNYVNAAYPTNNVFGFEKANYRVPADIDDPAISPYNYANVTLYVVRGGTNTSGETINYKVDSEINDNSTVEEWNNYFPLQPGSDYAVPLPANQNTVIRNYPLTNYDRVSTNYDFNVANGTISFPANSGAGT